MQPRRSAGFHSAHLKCHGFQALGQSRGRKFSGTSGLDSGGPDMDGASQKGACGDDHAGGKILKTGIINNPFDCIVFNDQRFHHGLFKIQIFSRFQDMLHIS